MQSNSAAALLNRIHRCRCPNVSASQHWKYVAGCHISIYTNNYESFCDAHFNLRKGKGQTEETKFFKTFSVYFQNSFLHSIPWTFGWCVPRMTFIRQSMGLQLNSFIWSCRSVHNLISMAASFRLLMHTHTLTYGPKMIFLRSPSFTIDRELPFKHIRSTNVCLYVTHKI